MSISALFEQLSHPTKLKALDLSVVLDWAWERAKGELNAMLATYWPAVGAEGDTARTEMVERVRNFVAEVEEDL